MVNIHPTAVVHPGAQIGEDVTIGPYTIVEDNTVIGDGCELAEHVAVHSMTRLGVGNRVDKGAALGGEAQHLRASGTNCWLEIGDRNTIREYVTIHRASKEGGVTRVGNDNLLMAFVHLGHDVQVRNHVQLANLATIGGHVVLCDNAVIGGMVAIHQWVTVGEMAMVGAMTGVNQDVPPYTLIEGVPGKVRGLNVVGLRRNGVDAPTRDTLKKAIRTMYLSKRNRALALEDIERDLPRSPELDRLIDFIKATRAGTHGRQLER